MNKYYEIRVYRKYKYKGGLYDENLLGIVKCYEEPSHDDIANAIVDNKGDIAKVVTLYELD